MAEDPSTGPDGPVDTEPQRLRRPDTRNALPAPRPPPIAGELGPPSPVVDEAAERTREPPVDVVMSPGRIYVTVEIPGASRETVDVEATDRRLIVTVRDARGTVYHREIPLPDAVDPKAVHATCRNGVLDVAIARARIGRNPSGEEGHDG